MAELTARARALLATGQRSLLGISGTPGAGKSTVCAALLASLGEDAALVSMDGFHLANDELVRLGRRQRKGASDTFDVDGYVALLWRLRNQSDDVIYAPRFDRGLEEAIGSAVAVRREVPLVLTEGNYLLLEDDGWDQVRSCLDEVWFIDTPSDERVDRLVARRRLTGESTAAATSWVLNVDRVNAGRVETSRARADLVVRLTTDLRPPAAARRRGAGITSHGAAVTSASKSTVVAPERDSLDTAGRPESSTLTRHAGPKAGAGHQTRGQECWPANHQEEVNP